jgi:hypothetical protein
LRQAKTADLRPVQTIDPVAHSGEHALDLMVFAFGQGQPQLAF